MNFEAGFLADNTYGVKHMNRLVRSLVTKGIVDYPFPEDESDIGAFNINGFIQFLSEDGVIPETCKSMLVEKTNTGYLLNPGMAFLDNGVYIFIENIQSFDCEPGMKVYWMHNSLTDKVEFICAAEYPASGSYLPLAEILANGTVSNVRKSARAKLPGMVSDYNKSKKISIDESFYFDEKVGPYLNGWGYTHNFDLGGNNFKYLLFVWRTFTSWALIDLETGACRYTYAHRSSSITTVDSVARWNELQPSGDLGVGDRRDFSLSPGYTSSGSASRDICVDLVNISEDGILTVQFMSSGIDSPANKYIELDLYVF